MTVTQRAADFEFLTDGEGFLRTDNLELTDSSTRSPFYGFHIKDRTQVHLQSVSNELLQFLLSKGYLPAIEVYRFLVVIVQHL